jgi:NAD(P)-dependent dehydrogenase (short-subunit alcohol dehydrogenase family)
LGLVANAGAYLRAPAVDMTVDLVEASLRVNFFGAFHPIMLALPPMVQRGKGHLVVVSSVDGRRPLPGDGPYAIAKSALSGLAQVLRQELRPAGIGVTAVFPGRIDTDMIADLKVPRISKKVPPARVARAIVRGIEHDRPEVVVPRSSRLLLYADLLSPRGTEWLVARLGLSGRPTNGSAPPGDRPREEVTGGKAPVR